MDIRVTSNRFSESLIQRLATLTLRQEKLQTQIATGQRIVDPEDDPGSVRRVLNLQAEQKVAGQYKANISMLKSKATASLSGIKALKKISDRVNEIAILADNVKSPTDLRTYAREVSNQIQTAVSIVNTKYQGDYLYGGTRIDQAPYVLTTDADDYAVAVAYQGNTAVPSAEIAEGVTVTVQAPGENTSGTGAQGLITDSRTGADFLNHLIALQNDLLAGDTSAIHTTDMPLLEQDSDNFITLMADNGATQSQLEVADALASGRLSAADQSISVEADADLAEALVKLNQTQNAYQASIQSGAAIMSLSLLDYIR